jgi:hypothetical protein
VAGVAALCFSIKPNATNQEVREAIEDTATLQSQAPFGEFSNYGLVNAEAALQRLTTGAGVTPHPPVVRYVSHLQEPFGGTDRESVSRIYGRGFGAPGVVELSSLGRAIGVIARSRDWIDFQSTFASGSLDVKVNGNLVSHVLLPKVRSAYPLVEASTQSATLTGGFFDTLNADANQMTCSKRSDGYIVVQGTFRKVPGTRNYNLILRRQYTGTTVGTETVQLYDWSSNSYPYGNFVTVGSGPCPTTMTTSNYSVTNPGRFIDPEGTVYLLITTSNDLPDGAKLRLDVVRLDGQ